MLKWVIELNMFNITFVPRKAIKGRVLVDFIIELTQPTTDPIVDPAEGRKYWTLMVDG